MWTGALRRRCTCAGRVTEGRAASPAAGCGPSFAVPAGDHQDLVLEISGRPLDGRPPDSAETLGGHRGRVAGAVPDLPARRRPGRRPRLRGAARPDQPGRRHGRRGHHRLPERAEEGRNYDYRYAWIRDQCYAGQAVAAAGPYPLLDDAVGFVTERLLADGPGCPAYTVDGGPVPGRAPAGTCPATPAAPTRSATGSTGSSSWTRSARGCCCSRRPPGTTGWTSDHWRAAEAAVDAIEKRWRRAGRRHLGAGQPAVGALPADLRGRTAGHRRRGARGAGSAWAGWPTRWSPTSPATACTPPAAGSAPRATSGSTPRCSCRHPGALPAGDPRTLATIDAVANELGRDGYLYRFRQDERPLGEAEGAFLLCGFAMALAAAPARPRGRGGPLVRAQPGRLRHRPACSPRSTTSSSGRCAATSPGVRARAAARIALSGWPTPWPDTPAATASPTTRGTAP